MEAAVDSLLDADRIASLAGWLRDRDIRATPHQCLLVRRLLIGMCERGQLPARPEQLSSWLGPVFCTTAEQQGRFPAVFAEWWLNEFGKEIPVEPRPGDEKETVHANARVRPWRPKWILFGCLGLLAVWASWAAWEEWHWQTLPGRVKLPDGSQATGAWITFGNEQFRPDQSGGFILRFRKNDLPRSLTVGQRGFITDVRTIQMPVSPPLEISLKNEPVVDPKPQVQTELPYTRVEHTAGAARPIIRLEREIRPPVTFEAGIWTLVAVFYLTIVAMVAGIIAVILHFYRRSHAPVLERIRTETPKNLSEVRIAGGAQGLLPRLGIRELARDLRRRRAVPSRDLDVAASLDATLQGGGIIAPVFRSRVEPEYLLLIDRASLRDHQAAFADAMAETLESGNVSIQKWYFDGEPVRCRRDSVTTAGTAAEILDLEELAARYPEHRVLMFSEADTFFDPFWGRTRPWVELLRRWQDPVVLTLERREGWGAREAAVERLGIVMLPLTRSGIAVLSALFSGHSADLGAARSGTGTSRLLTSVSRRWLDRESPPAERVATLLEQLASGLGPAGFQWLAACAVYPEVHWGITLRLGSLIVPAPDEVELLLPRLARLIWLREAFMPDWFRAALLHRIDPAVALQVRGALAKMLGEAALNRDQSVALDIAVGKPPSKGRGPVLWRRCIDWLRARTPSQLFRKSLRNSDAESPVRDLVFLHFMSGRKVPALGVAAPGMLARLLHKDGQRTMGLRPAVWWSGGLAIAAGVILASGLSHPVLRDIQFSPDGSRLAAVSGDRTIKLWDAANGKEIATLRGHTDRVSRISFSPDGTRLASGSDDQTIKIWDTGRGREVATLRGSQDAVWSVAFSPGGKLLAGGSSNGSIKLWDVADGGETATWGGNSQGVTVLAFSPDGTRLASGNSLGGIKLWDPTSGKELADLEPSVQLDGKGALSFSYSRDGTGFAFTPDGSRLASWSSRPGFKLWDATSGKEIVRSLATDQSLQFSSGKTATPSFSPDASRFASGSDSGALKLWDVATGQNLATLETQHREISGLAYRFDGRQLASSGEDGKARIWSLEDSASFKVLLIGCDYSQDGSEERSPLSTPVSDVQAVGRVLNEQYGAGVTTLVNASRSVMEDELDRFGSSVTADDSVIVMFAGNGGTVSSKDGELFSFLLASDPTSRGISSAAEWDAKAIRDFVSKMPARQVMLIADAGNGGYLISGDVIPASGDRLAKTRVVLASARGNQSPADTPQAGSDHSPFAQALLQFLEEKTGSFAGVDLVQGVAKRMETIGVPPDRQQPAYGALGAGGLEGGDFIFPSRIAPAAASLPGADASAESQPTDRQSLAEFTRRLQNSQGNDDVADLTGALKFPGDVAAGISAIVSEMEKSDADDFSRFLSLSSGLKSLIPRLDRKDAAAFEERLKALAAERVGNPEVGEEIRDVTTQLRALNGVPKEASPASKPETQSAE